MTFDFAFSDNRGAPLTQDVQGVRLSVNGTPIAGRVELRMTLADFLRAKCGLTGTHLGCKHGACGACTALLDGDAVRSCLLFAVQVVSME